METPLIEKDKDIFDIINEERDRQYYRLEMIASENLTTRAVMEAQGSVLTNKYAEGYPNARYYGGCEAVDKAESLAIERAKKLFKAEYVNVQPHSGSQANMGVYLSILKPGDKIMGMSLAAGGHLTHGSKVNFSGKIFQAVAYNVNPDTHVLDYDELMEMAKKEEPKVIVAGGSAYPRTIDFKKFREIADAVGAYLMVDMAHFGGLVVTGLHPSPVPHAHFVTGTTHKTLQGPRGGYIISATEELAKKVNKTIFPGIQGGPLMHVIAAKAVCFKRALSPEFKEYQQQVMDNISALSEELVNKGYKIVSGGTDTHLILLNTMESKGITGKLAEEALDRAFITTNKNGIPNDPQPPKVTSGIRIGTPAVTARGLKTQDMKKVAEMIDRVLSAPEDESVIKAVSEEVKELCDKYPLYKYLY